MHRRTLLACIALIIVADSAESATKKARKATRNRTVEPKFSAEAVNRPGFTGTEGFGILRAQILLDRAHFSPGEIDGRPGANFDRAIRGFQTARKIEVSGKLDQPTWAALNADSSPVVVPYRITDIDAAGPFAPVPNDMMEMAKVKRPGYAGIEEALGEMFHSSPALLTKMNPGVQFAAGQEILVPNVLTTPTGKATRLVVTKAGVLTAFDASGNVIAQYPTTSGSEHDPLPLGEWKITGVFRDPVFHYNPELFWDADPAHSKAKIQPGPNNPVGLVWIDLTKEHYGIHGTPEPSKVGHTQSHGCIRLTNWDVTELANLVAKGLPVTMQE